MDCHVVQSYLLMYVHSLAKGRGGVLEQHNNTGKVCQLRRNAVLSRRIVESQSNIAGQTLIYKYAPTAYNYFHLTRAHSHCSSTHRSSSELSSSFATPTPTPIPIPTPNKLNMQFLSHLFVIAAAFAVNASCNQDICDGYAGIGGMYFISNPSHRSLTSHSPLRRRHHSHLLHQGKACLPLARVRGNFALRLAMI